MGRVLDLLVLHQAALVGAGEVMEVYYVSNGRSYYRPEVIWRDLVSNQALALSCCLELHFLK